MTMFFVEWEDGARLVCGYNNYCVTFSYCDFELRPIIELPDWEPLVVGIFERLGIDPRVAIPRIKEGLVADAEREAYYNELDERRDQRTYAHWCTAMPLEQMRAEISAFRDEIAAIRAKRIHTARRRASFNSHRDMLVLRLLAAGKPYICAIDGCEKRISLTIDHILALSRGGSDELSNLQFLCLSHNSAKGDRDPPP